MMRFNFEIGSNVMPYCRDINLITDYLKNNKYDDIYINDDIIMCSKDELGTLTITKQGNFFIDKEICVPKEKENDNYILLQIKEYTSNLKPIIEDFDKLLNSKMIKDDIKTYWPEDYKYLVKKGRKYPFVTKNKIFATHICN